MRRFLQILVCTALITSTLSSCSLFEDNNAEIEEIKKRQEELEKRIAALEEWRNVINSDVASLKQLVELSQSGKVIVSCDEFTNETGSGYRITFSDNSIIHVYHGAKGDTGTGVNSPIIGMQEFEGVLYYVQQIGDGEPQFILDAAGQKVPVATGGGVVGRAPIIGVDAAGYWTIDIGDGSGAVRIKDVKGAYVQATGAGLGDSVFEKILFTDTSIEFFLRTGGSFVVKREAGGGEIRLATVFIPDFTTTKVHELYYYGDKVGLVCREYVPSRSRSEMSTVLYSYRKTGGYGAGVILESGDTINFDGSNPRRGVVVSTPPTSITLMGTGQLMANTNVPAGTANFAATALYVEDFDNNLYPLVKLAGTIWMAENLRTLSYNDGTSIPSNLSVTDMNGGANQALEACVPYGSYDARSELPAVKQTIKNYGLLYNGVVMGSAKIAPKGSHVATKAEWEVMLKYVSATNVSNKAGLELFSTTLWTGGAGTNVTGFSIPGGGSRSNNGFELEGKSVSFWAANRSSVYHITQNVASNNVVWSSISPIGRCMYVRCVVD